MPADRKIRKAVFPVAGLGTRFLPVTKANPKEMLPIVDKPLVQYAAEEAIAAGIDTLIFVNGKNKRSIEDHFDSVPDLANELTQKGKLELLEQVRNIVPPGVSCVNLRQPEPLGLGDAVRCAEAVIGDEPFAVLLADDLVTACGGGCLKQLVEVHAKTGGSVLALEEITLELTERYGIIGGNDLGGGLWKVTQLVEKPPPAQAPSRMAVIGRYVLQPGIFEHLKDIDRGIGNEVQLTDAIARQMQNEEVYALHYQGRRYDCGSKLGYLQANVAFALEHEEIGEDFRDWLNTLEF